MKDATEVMPELPMNGSTTTTSLIKPVPPIRLTVMTMESDVLLKLNARTAFQEKDAGLKKELKSTVLMSSEMLKEKKI